VAPAYPDGLSEREVEVLRLLASGRSNQAIAGELVISVNTVFRHVSNIFAKTGASNRVEAAAYAQRHGLIESPSSRSHSRH
jgi:DNA-binding NarL/FixJ family response regulator